MIPLYDALFSLSLFPCSATVVFGWGEPWITKGRGPAPVDSYHLDSTNTADNRHLRRLCNEFRLKSGHVAVVLSISLFPAKVSRCDANVRYYYYYSTLSVPTVCPQLV